MSNIIKDIVTNPFVVLYGGAGVGKSFQLQSLKMFFETDTLFCSPTGQGALNIGGVTCHKLFGLPFGVTDQLLPLHRKMAEVLKNPIINRIVIDEAWMLRADMLDHINSRLKKVKRNNKPFGGLSVILVGDPFQLPLVLTQQESKLYNERYKTPYMIGSEVWGTVSWKYIELTEVKRQTDADFIKALNSIRKNDSDVRYALDFINSKCLNKPQQGVILSPRNYEVDKYNMQGFSKLSSPIKTYKGIGTGFKGQLPIPEEVSLRAGARVVLCANHHSDYTNGDSGVVLDCFNKTVRVKLDRGEEVTVDSFRFSQIEYELHTGKLRAVEKGWYEQLPIKMGYSLSVHKSQGMAIANMSFDTGGYVFAPSLTYVALSRAKTLDGLSLITPLKEKDVWVDKTIREWFLR